MFQVGQTVYHKIRKLRGTVLECDGGIVYIAQENGVELNFRTDELTATPPAQPGQAAAAAANLSRVLTAGDINDEHRRVLAAIPRRALESVVTVFERQPNAGKFGALGVAEKLNFIAYVTEVPYRTMREHSRSPGTLTLMMGRGLAASLGRRGEGS